MSDEEDAAKLEELLPEEFALARADVRCQVALDYSDRQNALYDEPKRELLYHHEEKVVDVKGT